MERVDSSFHDLYKRAQRTSRSRFNAARRLNQHNQVALWTISLSSVCLIFHSLVQAMEMSSPFSPQVYSLVTVASAVVILVFSVVVAKSEFGQRAEKMHHCAILTNDMVARLHPYT